MTMLKITGGVCVVLVVIACGGAASDDTRD
jgi:hypothetical protein